MRILSLTLVLLILFGCSKDEDTKTKASTSPLVATWQLDDLKIEGEIAGVKFSYDLDGLINQIGSNDEAPPKEQVKACIESVQMAFKKDTYKIYPSNTDSACKQLEEASGSYTEDGKKITFEKSLDFILEGIPLKEANYTIADNVLTLSFDSLYNGITVKLTILLNKEDM